jgi:tetratricopeptide (TPR) repeat protein
LRASDIFEIILKEFKNSKLKDEAQLALGDTFFLRNDFKEALSHYQELLRDNPDTGLKAQALFRLSESEFKLGDSSLGKEYLDKLKQEFSLNPELKLDKDLFGASDSSGKTVYTVQVGSFSSNANAAGLTQKLIQLGYPAYLEEVVSMEAPIYKVRVGKFSSLQEAKDTQDKLSAAGFPTKLCP